MGHTHRLGLKLMWTFVTPSPSPSAGMSPRPANPPTSFSAYFRIIEKFFQLHFFNLTSLKHMNFPSKLGLCDFDRPHHSENKLRLGSSYVAGIVLSTFSGVFIKFTLSMH